MASQIPIGMVKSLPSIKLLPARKVADLLRNRYRLVKFNGEKF